MSKIAFCWTNGVRNKDRFDRWNDGLRAAMRLIEQDHEVTYHEPEDDIPEVDWILFWEAPCTFQSAHDGWKYQKLLTHPSKKALLFAGGPIKYEWVKDFDHVFVESKINEDEFNAIRVRNSRAFGVNTDIFKPINIKKEYDTVTHGTCASWKRQWLVCQAIGPKALVFGQRQQHDTRPFDECSVCGSEVIGEVDYGSANLLLNKAYVSVNCADFWGGGQRATLEAMACNLPVVVMSDSPKNREFVDEAGIGAIVDPEPQHIKKAVERLKETTGGREYVLSKWTPEHYKNAILTAL